MRSTILGLALLAVAGCGLVPHARPAGDGRRAGRPARTAAVPPGRVPATARALPCTLSPRACGFPDATDTGVPAWATLHEVPGQVASGTGWAWVPADHEVQVTGRGATLTGLRIVGTLDVMASDVTVDDVQVATDGGNFAVSLRHTDDVTIKNSTITGQNSAAGRVGVGIDDIFGDSAGTTISDDNISDFKTGIQVSTGRVTGNYIHNPGYLAGDHTNGILDLGTTQPLLISHNTILISLGQTDAISLDASKGGQAIGNKSIVDNLLGGGSYTIYGGNSHGNATSNIVISGNVFSQQFFPDSGQFGAAAYFSARGAGNRWSGNTWDDTGQVIGFADGAAARAASQEQSRAS